MVEPFPLVLIFHSNCINVTLVCGDEAHKSSLMFKVTSSRIGGFGSLF